LLVSVPTYHGRSDLPTGLIQRRDLGEGRSCVRTNSLQSAGEPPRCPHWNERTPSTCSRWPAAPRPSGRWGSSTTASCRSHGSWPPRGAHRSLLWVGELGGAIRGPRSFTDVVREMNGFTSKPHDLLRGIPPTKHQSRKGCTSLLCDVQGQVFPKATAPPGAPEDRAAASGGARGAPQAADPSGGAGRGRPPVWSSPPAWEAESWADRVWIAWGGVREWRRRKRGWMKPNFTSGAIF